MSTDNTQEPRDQQSADEQSDPKREESVEKDSPPPTESPEHPGDMFGQVSAIQSLFGAFTAERRK
ncbi:hypothetical protein [Mariniluteicoccus flavus]